MLSDTTSPAYWNGRVTTMLKKHILYCSRTLKKNHVACVVAVKRTLGQGRRTRTTPSYKANPLSHRERAKNYNVAPNTSVRDWKRNPSRNEKIGAESPPEGDAQKNVT